MKIIGQIEDKKVAWECEVMCGTVLCLLVGSFFAKALVNSEQYMEEEDKLAYKKNDLVMVKDIGQQSLWEGTLLSTGQHGLVPVHAMQPLPYPFYQ